MDRRGLWGASLISVCVFKIVMTPLFGVRPDPINLTITLMTLVVGGLWIVWSSVKRRTRGQAEADRQRPEVTQINEHPSERQQLR